MKLTQHTFDIHDVYEVKLVPYTCGNDLFGYGDTVEDAIRSLAADYFLWRTHIARVTVCTAKIIYYNDNVVVLSRQYNHDLSHRYDSHTALKIISETGVFKQLVDKANLEREQQQKINAEAQRQARYNEWQRLNEEFGNGKSN